jgi:hypothetical protein
VLQDRPEVIGGITEELLGVEKMGYDFFTPQPIQGISSVSKYIRTLNRLSSGALIY